MSMHFHHEDGLQDDEGEVDLKSRHGCTDVPCCLLFAAALVAFSVLYSWCGRTGNLGRLYHGINYKGQICGVDPDVADKPFLYWCPLSMAGSELTLNMEKPICVDACPGAGTAGPASTPMYTIQPECEVVSGPEGVSSYKTMSLMGRYCVPRSGAHTLKTMTQKVTGGQVKGWAHNFMETLSTIPAAWPVLVGVFFVSIVLGYLYLAMLRHCAEPLIWVSMVLVVLGFGLLGCYLWRSAADLGQATLPAGVSLPEGSEGNQETAVRVVAVVSWAIALAVVFLACCFRHSIAAASACAEVACDAMFEMPSLLVAPVVKALVKGLLCFILLYGFLLLYSTASISEQGGDGITRSFEFKPKQYYMMLFYMVASFWILAFVSALYQFVIAYATAEYYFTPYDHDDEKDVGCCVLCEGLHIGLLYHTGSLAFGSLLIALLQTFQKVIEYAEAKNEETANSQVVKILLCCCACCVNCCKDTIQFINKNAYIDMAITSHNFCDAAKQAVEMIIELGGAMAILNGATYVFTFFGTALITLACGALAYVAAAHGAFADAESVSTLGCPLAPMVVSMLLGCLVALDFMNVFDMVSDTLLYCYGTDLHSGKGGYTAPAALKELVHGGEHGGDPAARQK
mmetsp:Transcript_113965/g.302883  ORF Transcript_113965/g.302883 Transcript_113965/m.302883 type:complete len:627 (-) Transcript_113965:171-2051(-)